jgi:hypothetical protein
MRNVNVADCGSPTTLMRALRLLMVGMLDEPIPSSPRTANWRAIKAAWMAVIYGRGSLDSMRRELLRRIDKVRDAEARLAVADAIDRLAPEGDVKAAEALEKIMAANEAAGDKNVIAADEPLAVVSLRLRARAAP